MKRFLIGIATTLLLVGASAAGQAQESSGVQVGIDMWLNQWTQDRPGFASTTSDFVMLLGPTIEVTLPSQVFVKGSYLVSTSDYTFSDVVPPFNVERQDVNAALGYWIVPGFGILAGYRDTTLNDTSSGVKDTLYGPLIGIVGDAYVDDQLSFYGRLDYLFTKFEEKDALGTFSENSPGWMVAFGVKYAFTRSFTGSFGYRYETNQGDISGINDSFSGVTFSGLFTF